MRYSMVCCTSNSTISVLAHTTEVYTSSGACCDLFSWFSKFCALLTRCRHHLTSNSTLCWKLEWYVVPNWTRTQTRTLRIATPIFFTLLSSNWSLLRLDKLHYFGCDIVLSAIVFATQDGCLQHVPNFVKKIKKQTTSTSSFSPTDISNWVHTWRV